MTGALKDIASHFSQVADSHEQEIERLTEDNSALQREAESLRIDLSAANRENELLRTLVLEQTERAERLQRLYFSVVTEFRIVDTLIRESLMKAREAAKDFKLNEAQGALQGDAGTTGIAAVEGVLASVVRQAGRAATEASIGHDTQREVPGFLTTAKPQGMKDLVAKIK